jgi:maltooligosyltrehalose trehalohydrolase
MGEEWRASTPFQFFTSFDERWLADAVRTGRRAEFAAHGWKSSEVPDPQDPTTRASSALDWADLGRPGHGQMLDFYRELINTRRSEPDLASGDLEKVSVDFDESARWLVVHRGQVHVVCNLSSRSQPVPVGFDVDRVLVSWGRAPVVNREGIRLDGHDVAVVRTR